MELQKYLLAQVGSLIGLQYVLPPDLPPHSALKCKVVGGRVVGNVDSTGPEFKYRYNSQRYEWEKAIPLSVLVNMHFY